MVIIFVKNMFGTYIFSFQDNTELTSNDVIHFPLASEEDSEPSLCDISDKFGHCASYDSVVRYETGLSIQRMETNKTVPKGFRPGVFAVAVWDNIDMVEETGSGSGTTHHTNGILVQPSVSEFD